ncbi:MAG: hypothetical protein J0I15_07175 [Herbaspirillum huttiense]|uniref:hypothetical protein n=1 Tax=Herbaspirillum huttiense TaxID=863372 RepID=UPI001AC7DAF6|nr:hypothetical protein [Herbaspirillum huttiense]MBN9356211.1 hypothetical protein [Herbaspirillum huttiense]
MNNDENGIGLPPPTRPAPPVPDCKPARREVPQFMQDTLDRVNAKERKNLETRVMWAACLTLERLGYTWEGGAEWKPPLGKAPNFDLLDAARAEIEELRQQLARQEVRMDASPGFMEQSLARVSAAAGQDASPADAPLETSEDEARPYTSPASQGDDNVVDAEWPPASPQALQLAAQAWCEPGTEHLVMQPRLAEAFGRILDRQQREECANTLIGAAAALSGRGMHDAAKVLRGLVPPARQGLLAVDAVDAPVELRLFPNDGSQPEDTAHLVGIKFGASEATKMVEDAIAASGYPWTAAARDVLAERRRQQEVEGWTPEHDDEHVSGEISALAAFYAMPPAAREWDASSTGYGETLGQAILPPDWRAKAGDRREELKKAGALILAEIERLDRAAEKGGAA